MRSKTRVGAFLLALGAMAASSPDAQAQAAAPRLYSVAVPTAVVHHGNSTWTESIAGAELTVPRVMPGTAYLVTLATAVEITGYTARGTDPHFGAAVRIREANTGVVVAQVPIFQRQGQANGETLLLPITLQGVHWVRPGQAPRFVVDLFTRGGTQVTLSPNSSNAAPTGATASSFTALLVQTPP
jgi:hypothetical protein